MAVDSSGSVAAGTFYVMDPTVIPWNITNPIYKNVGVTVIASNFNASAISDLLGIYVPTIVAGLLPFKVLLIIYGPQRNAPAIATDIESVFGMQSGSLQALASSPVTLPVSVFADLTLPAGYSSFVSKFVEKTSNKPVVIGKYSASLLESSPSVLTFTSVLSLAFTFTNFFGNVPPSAGSIISTYGLPFSLNSTGAFLVRKNFYDFSQAADRTTSFSSITGLSGGLSSTTNETFATILPGESRINSFSPSNMIVQSAPTSFAGRPLVSVVGVFPWVGNVQRLLPDISVNFRYPGFDAPVLGLSWATNPSGPYVGQNFTLTLTLRNIGSMDAKKLHANLGFSAVRSLNERVYGPSINPSIAYDVASLPRGYSDTRLFNFTALTPEAPFSISATFQGTDNFAYTWTKPFSVAGAVRQGGPLSVAKTVTPASPAFGEAGNVTVTVTNPSTSGQTFYNVIPLSPDATSYYYLNSTSPTQSVPQSLVVTANSTHFTFLANGEGTLTSISVKPNATSYFYYVDGVRIPLSRNDSWRPPNPYRYPNFAVLNIADPVTVTLSYENRPSVTATGTVQSGPLPQGNPMASYLGVNCSSCMIFRGSNIVIQGSLENATGRSIQGTTIQLSYSNEVDRIPHSLANVTTDSSGTYAYTWNLTRQLSIGKYVVQAYFPGTSAFDPDTATANITLGINSVGPGQTLSFSYPYYFNATGTFTIGQERVIYSSIDSLPTGEPLIGEYIAVSNPVSVTIGSPVILPILQTTMNVTRFESLYFAKNQSYVQITLDLKNTGAQTASNITVESLIPRPFSYSSYDFRRLPVVLTEPGLAVNDTKGTVSFAVPSLSQGQEVSYWYVVWVNRTDAFASRANVTAWVGARQFHFSWDGPLLAVYPDIAIPPTQPRGFLQVLGTVDPPVIADGASTTLTLHIFNMGNVTYNSISASVQGYGDLIISGPSRSVPDMPPGTFQTVSFPVTVQSTSSDYGASRTFYMSGTLSYRGPSLNQLSTTFQPQLTSYNSVLHPTIDPRVRIDVSPQTASLAAGDTEFAAVTVSNVGSSNVTNLSISLQAYSPLFSPDGTTTPELSYGQTYTNWGSTIGPGETVKFRVGIRTRAGGTYPLFVTSANYDFASVGGSGYVSLSGSTGAVYVATDNSGPIVSVPWKSPFAPGPSDPVIVWTQVADASGIGSVRLEYSTDNKQSWSSVPMTPIIGSAVPSDRILSVQSAIGDIYNMTIPAQTGDTTVFYRVRAVDRLGNTFLEDNGGLGYQYTVTGSKSTVIVTQPGQNVLVDVSQQIPTLHAQITLNVTAPIQIHVTQLSSNPGGTPPAGTGAVGIFVQIEANETVALDARIRLFYQDSQVQSAGLDENTLSPYYWDGRTWVALENVQRDTQANWVEGTVHHFSLFGIFAAQVQAPKPSETPWLLIAVAGGAAAVVAASFGVYRSRVRKRGPPTRSPTTPSPASSAAGPQSSFKKTTS